MVKKICIVGNGESLCGKNLGAKIDTHDIVVRINHCFTLGLENDTGSKTHYWFISQAISKDMNFILYFMKPRLLELRSCGLHTIVQRVDDATTYAHRYSDIFFDHEIIPNFDLLKTNFKKITKKFLPNYDIFPTTGLLAILYFLENYKHVNIAGFGYSDRDSSGEHYWPPNFGEIDFKKYGHDMRVEREIINSLPVRRLDDESNDSV